MSFVLYWRKYACACDVNMSLFPPSLPPGEGEVPGSARGAPARRPRRRAVPRCREVAVARVLRRLHDFGSGLFRRLRAVCVRLDVRSGIKKSYVKKKVRHDQFLNVLKTLKPTPSTFRSFQSVNHVLRTVEINETCLNAFDDKRYILTNGVGTLAYGHFRIPEVATSL